MTTAPQAEAAWLSTYGDGLPALLVANGGTLDIIQAYLPRTPHKMKRALYVLYADTIDQRNGMQQAVTTHRLTCRLSWPISVNNQTAETGQAALEAAATAVITRVRGFVGDHTHGGRFLSAAEGVTAEDQDARIHVAYEDPEHSIANGFFRADITYSVDDLERPA